MKNCPNCGAPYDLKLNKCPYCGTSYFDMSLINMDAHEPFYLKIQTSIGGAPGFITAKVIPTLFSAEISREVVTVKGGKCDLPILSFEQDNSLDFGLNLRAVEDGGMLCKIEVER